MPATVLTYEATCLSGCDWSETGGPEVSNHAEKHTKKSGHATLTTARPTTPNKEKKK